jgi:putative membrane protein
MWHGLEGMGWGWLGVGVLHMIVFWALVILLLSGLARWLTGGSAGTSALDILKARYAKGEINREEFERMKRELTEQ